jgi:hypothetical protein
MAVGQGAWVDASAPQSWVAQTPPATVEIDLGGAPIEVERVLVLAWELETVPGARLRADTGEAWTFAADGLTSERALVMIEVYRRLGQWKVRAVGQGYSGGITELLADRAPTLPLPSALNEPDPANAGRETGLDPVRRLGMIFDDASRSTASFSSTVEFAQRRLDQDLSAVLEQPTSRVGPEADARRADAQARHDAMVSEAGRRHRADLDQLRQEVSWLEDRLPRPMASWGAPAWSSPGPGDGGAVRAGEVSPVPASDFRLPLIRQLPLNPPLWFDLGEGEPAASGPVIAALVARLSLAAPPGARVSVIDVGQGTRLGDLATVLSVATDPSGAAAVLAEHLEHLAVVELALETRSVDDLPARHRPGRALMVCDFPTGLSEADVEAVRSIALRGPSCGLSLTVSGRYAPSLGLASVQLVHDVCLRLPTVSGGDLVDAAGSIAWTFHPDSGPADPAGLVAAVRAAQGVSGAS